MQDESPPLTMLPSVEIRVLESEAVMRGWATRYVLVLAGGSCLAGCGHHPEYVTRLANHEDVPTSADFKELPMRRRGPDEPIYDFYRGLCRDHGFISGQTDDRVATQRAIDTHNERYHQGQRRADLLRTMVTP
jgi:hypothetical protein